MSRYYFNSQAYYDRIHQLAQIARKPSPEHVAEIRAIEESAPVAPSVPAPPTQPERKERRPLAA